MQDVVSCNQAQAQKIKTMRAPAPLQLLFLATAIAVAAFSGSDAVRIGVGHRTGMYHDAAMREPVDGQVQAQSEAAAEQVQEVKEEAVAAAPEQKLWEVKMVVAPVEKRRNDNAKEPIVPAQITLNDVIRAGKANGHDDVD